MALRPADSPGFQLWHVTLRWQRAMAAALTPLDLTHVQFVLLACAWWLNAHEQKQPNQLELARQAGTDVKMTSSVLATLERKDLVRRETDPRDTRAKRIVVTERGADLAPRAIEAVERADAEFFKPVPADETLGVLRRLAQS